MRSRALRWATALGIVAAIAWTSPATARDEPSEIDKDAARTLVQQGDELMESRDYEEALVAYRRADDIMGVPTTSIEVGRVAMKVGKLVEARDAFEKAASYPRRDGEPQPFTEARQEARKQLERLSPKIPRVTVLVEGLKKNAKEVEVVATLDQDEIPVNEEVLVDPGPHTVQAEADGYVTATEDIVLEEMDLRDVTLRLEEAPMSLWPMAYVGYGIAGVGVLVGAVTGALSLSDAQTVKDACDGDPESCPNGIPLERSLTLGHVSTASFVIAGVAAAVGTIGLVLSLTADDPNEDDEADAGVEAALRVGPTHAGLRLTF